MKRLSLQLVRLRDGFEGCVPSGSPARRTGERRAGALEHPFGRLNAQQRRLPSFVSLAFPISSSGTLGPRPFFLVFPFPFPLAFGLGFGDRERLRSGLMVAFGAGFSTGACFASGKR